jgi:serine/threonine protein kinase
VRQPVPFGKYLLLDRISVGGMAEVFKAKSYGVEGFEKIIAIKRILPTMGEDRDFIKMFIDEAKIAGQLAHANICQIFELGRIDGSHFIAMEYIWGKDLLQIGNRLRKVKQQMPIPMGCFAISKVLEGLDYAHRKRDPLGRPLEIVHRDCSPQNVLVSYEGEVKVIDFGIAKATSRNSRTMAGVLKGKFGYMSPEQVRGLPLDRRSDIFALGTMLFECLTGERLFQGPTDFSTLEKVRNVDIPSPRSVNPKIPEAVEKVILKALARDVEDRYQWCSEMLADLQQYLMAQEVVFTAKSLSSWLKETFAQEIERERQQLEQYKRVGRDGLIAGVPAAEARLDVDEHLGEAGAPEGDATVLGGPNFDDIEQAAGAAPSLPAVRPRSVGEHDSAEFGEEAPTEIFGEIGGNGASAPASLPPAAGRPPPAQTPRPSRTGTLAPPAPSAPRAPAPLVPQSGPHVAMRAPGSGPQPAMPPPLQGGFAPEAAAVAPQMSPGLPPNAGGTYPPPAYASSHGSVPPQLGMGLPGSPPVAPAAPPTPAATRTVLGIAAPVIPSYGAYRPPPPSQGYPQPQAYAPPGYTPSGYGSGGYVPLPQSGPQPLMQPPAATAQEVQGERKKSTLVRDIGIGVAIAAVVLVGFLLVKLFVFDGGSKSTESTTSTSTIATVKLSLPKDVTVRMFLDGKLAGAALRDGDSIPVTAGPHSIKVVGPKDQACEQPIQLEPGQTTSLKCEVLASAPPAAPAPPSNGSATGSAAGSGAGSGSGTVKETTAPEVKAAAEVKSAETAPSKLDAKSSESKPATAPAPATPKPADSAATTAPVTAKPAKPADVKTSSTPAPAAPPTDPSQGLLVVSSKPAAKLLIDGTDTGKSTSSQPLTFPLTPGKHRVSLVVGGDRYTYPIVVKAGQTETMNKDLQ